MDDRAGVDEPFYRMIDLSKKYLDNLALSGVDLTFDRGRISGLIGKNGAGKSTLVNIMYGALDHTGGEIRIDGKPVAALTPARAQDLGVFLVPQKVQHAHDLTIAENLFLGRYPRSKYGLVDVRTMRRKAEELIARLGLRLSPNLLLGKLTIEHRRLLDVAKALWVYGATMVILDETTAALSIRSKAILYGMLRDAKREGRSVVFITHRLKEIMEICDDVTVLRDGRVVGSRDTASASLDQLAEMIIGKRQDVDMTARTTGGSPSEAAPARSSCLEIKNLSQHDRFRDVTFSAARNEIIGVAGILGSGYNDLLRCLGGIDARGRTGEILVNGRAVGFDTTDKLQRAGIGYLTNNREEEGLFHTMTVEENMFCGTYRHFRNRLGLIDRGKVRGDLADKVRIMDIKLHSPTLLIDSLSGGNKQKVMVSRLLNQKAEILLFDEIAEGIDIEARNKLLRFISEDVRRDKLLILASNIVEDLMTICDRILVINHGRLYRSFTRDEFDEQGIYAAIQDLKPAE